MCVCVCVCVCHHVSVCPHLISIDCLDDVLQFLLDAVALQDINDAHEQEDLPPISAASRDTFQQHTAGNTNKQHMKAVKVQIKN